MKTYAEERELSIEIAVDTGPSMDFGSRRWTKREAAAQVAALLAYVAIQAQDRVGLTLFGAAPRPAPARGQGSQAHPAHRARGARCAGDP